MQQGHQNETCSCSGSFLPKRFVCLCEHPSQSHVMLNINSSLGVIIWMWKASNNHLPAFRAMKHSHGNALQRFWIICAFHSGSRRRDLNPQHSAYKADALPIELPRHMPRDGIEPPAPASSRRRSTNELSRRKWLQGRKLNPLMPGYEPGLIPYQPPAKLIILIFGNVSDPRTP